MHCRYKVSLDRLTHNSIGTVPTRLVMGDTYIKRDRPALTPVCTLQSAVYRFPSVSHVYASWRPTALHASRSRLPRLPGVGPNLGRDHSAIEARALQTVRQSGSTCPHWGFDEAVVSCAGNLGPSHAHQPGTRPSRPSSLAVPGPLILDPSPFEKLPSVS